MASVKRLTPTAVATASLIALAICLMVAFAWHSAARPFGAAKLIERHQIMSARLDGMMICMLQVEMAHERYLAGGRKEDQEQRDKALATLGATLRAINPAELDATGHRPRFYLLQQHAISRLPSWLTVAEPSPVPARGMLRSSARRPHELDGEERLLAARERGLLDSLLAERANWERYVRAALAVLTAMLVLALCLSAAVAYVNRSVSGAYSHLGQQMQLRRVELDQAREQLLGALAARADAEQALLEHEDAIAARERLRIARDMHDGIGQDLFALKLELDRLYVRTKRRHPRLHAGAGQLLGLANEVMANLRAILDDLRPEGLEHSLETAIRRQVDKFTRRWGRTCKVDLLVEPIAVNQQTANAAFRVLQEALTNIRRHANATHVRVRLWQSGEQLFMSVTDNGRGFAAVPGIQGRSFGLVGMRERIDALGGRLEIDSVPGHGTSLAVALPL